MNLVTIKVTKEQIIQKAAKKNFMKIHEETEVIDGLPVHFKLDVANETKVDEDDSERIPYAEQVLTQQCSVVYGTKKKD